MKKGFNNKRYVSIQSKKIKERFKIFDKLYLEVGGKLFCDNHASRVLPGFEKDAKIKMFLELKKDLEIIFCINASDIEKNKIRSEFGITYDIEMLNIINNATSLGFTVNSVVITLYNNQESVDKFIKRLERQNIKTYIHTFTKGYPTDIETITAPSPTIQKIIHYGQLYIIRDGKTYNLMGVEVENMDFWEYSKY